MIRTVVNTLLLRNRITMAVCFFFSISASAQTTIKGYVRDASGKQPLSSATVSLRNTPADPDTRITGTDSSGLFLFQLPDPFPATGLTLVVTIIGYKTQTVSLKSGTADLSIWMKPDSKLLKEVTVKSKRAKYRNRDNPAVELIRHVIDNKDKNRPGHYEYTEYEEYQKLQVALTKVSSKLSESKLLRKYHFLFENIDSTKLEGKSIIPIYMEEKLSNIYLRKSPFGRKTVLLADKQVNFGEFIDNRGVSAFLNRLYEDVNIYDNNIPLFTNEFLSPIADVAPTLYRYYIRDTTVDQTGQKLVRIYFTPRNSADFLFRGEMVITLDSNYSVTKLNMYISPNINLNFVREMHIDQDFERGADGRYYVIRSNVMAEAGLSKENSGGFFAERMVSYRDLRTGVAHDKDFYKGPAEQVLDSAGLRTDSFWTARRHDTLTKAESKVYQNIDSLQKMGSYKRFMDIATLFLAGYKSFGKFEVGPVNTFYSFNPVEGFRLRLGGRTTTQLSKRYYFETYAAYGFKDQKWKGYLGVTYSLNNKSIYDYPMDYIRVSAQRDTKIPGQELQFVQEDNFLLSFKRGNNDKWLYNNFYRFDYVHEYSGNFSHTIGFKYWEQEPAGSLLYQQVTKYGLQNISSLTTTELSMEFRWAPHEQFYQGKLYRIPIINRYPIYTLRLTEGIKNLLGGQYNYTSLILRVEKRVYLSQLGYTDVVFEGGNLFGQVPFPLLYVHRANQTYSYQLNSYNMMNFLEFVSDHYAGVNLDHHFNGFLFNRVPLLKKLKLREIASVKCLFGGVRHENTPSETNNLYQFPVDTNGTPVTYALGSGPYVEASVGIGNIFKLFRVDFVKRLTYMDHPGARSWGILGRFKLDF